MTAVSPAPPSRRPRLPVLGELSTVGRVAVIATVLASLVAIALDFGLHNIAVDPVG